MAPELSEDARELVQHFAELPEEDRGRILALVRSLNLCRTVEVYRAPWATPSLSRVTQGVVPSSGSTHRSPV
jgi:hypothetical protein